MLKYVSKYNFHRKLKGGQTTGGKIGGGIVVILISLMITILIGIIVVQSLVASQTQAGWSLAANTTWTALQSNIWVAFTLMVIIPVIIGAVAILGYLRFGGG